MLVSTRLPEAWRCHLAGDYLVLAVQALVEVIQALVEEIQVEVIQALREMIQVEVVHVKQALGKEVEEIVVSR
eukprot:SAG22_NODE_86_length_21440_cov_288.248700_9_plen_73_part_00